MSDLDKETKEFFESGGEKAPVEKSEVQDTKEKAVPEKTDRVEKEDVKAEVKEEKTPLKEAEKKEPESKEDDDPHAENHRKALKEARAEMKKLKKEKAEADAQREKELGEMREKFRIWTEAVNKQSQPEPAKFEVDPANYLKQEHEKTQSELAELRAFRQRQEQAYLQQAALQQFQNTLQAAEVEFSQEAPDYNEAAKHVGSLWQAELELTGVPSNQISQAYLFKVAQFANAAIRRGDNPAEAVYELAKRTGYKPQKPEAEKKIETLQKGMEASKSLGGGKPDVDFSLESLASMSQSEIDAFVANPKNWKKLA